MIPAGMAFHHATFQRRQRVFQQRYTELTQVIVDLREFIGGMASKMARSAFTVLSQNVDPKNLACADQVMNGCFEVKTDQDQRGIQGQRTERTNCCAMQLIFMPRGDYG